MRMTTFETFVCDAFRTNWVFVRITTDTGVHGWGEATLEYREKTVLQALHELEATLEGRDLRDIEAWWQDAYRDAYWRGGVVLTSALSAIEMALWDIKGKALGVPVYELLGGKVRSRVRAYANGWFTGSRTPADFARCARDTVAAGYTGLKWDPFGAAFRDLGRRELRGALDCIAAVRDAVGDEAELMIEGHGRFDLPSALRIAGELERFDILWFEEPLTPGNLENYARLTRATRTPISLGERLYTRWDFREVFERGCGSYVQPDVSHAGGIHEVHRIAALAEMWQVTICPHNPSGPVANAATLQLAAAVPNFGWLETMATDVPWRAEIAHEQARFADGFVEIPDAPGLGVDLDVEAMSRHPYEPHGLRHYTGALTDIRPAHATASLPT